MKKASMKFDYANAYGIRDNYVPVFLRCQGVRGSLEVENGSARTIDKVKIVLKGTIMNCIAHHADCSHNWLPQRLVCSNKLLDLVEAHDWPLDGTITNPDDNKAASFSFDFPLHRKPSWNTPTNVMAASTYPVIPSTISVQGYGCRTKNRFTCSATTQVSYEIQAYAFHRDEIVAQLTSPITIYDTALPSPPPIYLGHFQDEYVCRKEKHLTKLALRGPKLTIKASEPGPLEIKSQGGVLMAAVPLRLVLQADSKRANKTPPQFSVAATSVLRTSTYLSICKLQAHPTIAVTEKSPYLAALTKFAPKRAQNLTIDGGWQCDESKEVATWVRSLTVLLPAMENCYPAPSFFTPYLARRYSLAISLNVKSTWGDAAYRLTVPLQVVYPECPMDYELTCNPFLAEEHTSSSDSLPIYIR